MSAAAPRAVVFAYHNVGVRCLKVLLAHGVDVVRVVTHEDRPDEQIWFDSVAAVAREQELPVATPADPNTPQFVAQLAALRPDFLFSFYYRQMLAPQLLALPARGAYNMHGSLLPRYRGRVPVNWAVIRGERETGASLHAMLAKPDAGAIVAQRRVPILPDDTAGEVFAKVTVAAELALHEVLPALLAGTAPHIEQDLAAGSYFGGRRPEDGRIDWTQDAQGIHNLVRGVAPPYPGAFTTLADLPARVLRSRLRADLAPRSAGIGLYADGEWLLADCGRGVLQVLQLELEGGPVDATAFRGRFGSDKIFLV
jgi:methionyl-tRNA formyltransferase